MKVQHATQRLTSISADGSDTATIKVTAQRIHAIHVSASNASDAVIDRALYRIAIRDTESRLLPKAGTAIPADLLCPNGLQASEFTRFDMAGNGDVEVTIYTDVAIDKADVTLISYG
jgi:hypothetical protein